MTFEATPMCPTCGGTRWVVANPEPAAPGFTLPALSGAEHSERHLRRLAAPRIPCPRGCEPWPWDRARLAADAVLIAEANRVAA